MYIYMYVLYVIYINPIVIVANELGHHLAKILLFAKSGAPATSSAGRWDQTTLLWKSLWNKVEAPQWCWLMMAI